PEEHGPGGEIPIFLELGAGALRRAVEIPAPAELSLALEIPSAKLGLCGGHTDRADDVQRQSDQPDHAPSTHGRLLSGEGESRRMIRAVDDRVTAHARPAHHELERSGVTPVGTRRMPGLDVALLAEPRLRHLQHGLVVGAVRIVAVRAALVDRRVYPEK